MSKSVLITGGAGDIGSTIASYFKDEGWTPVVLDSLVRGNPEFTKNIKFYHADISDQNILKQIVSENDVEIVIHAAALVEVPESVEQPALYYRENVAKTLSLLENMQSVGLRKILFSSTAAVYQAEDGNMVTEESPLLPLSPYAKTKLTVEMMLQDLSHAGNIQAVSLRYFNPIGADPKMRSGMFKKNGSHVMAKLSDAAFGKIPAFSITGIDYPTRDGSGLRDYLHVWDLARAHFLAVEKFNDIVKESAYQVINLGTSSGVTVEELVAAYQKVLGKNISIERAHRRPGDTAGSFASSEKARRLLGWQALSSLEESIATAIDWEKRKI